MTRNIIELVEDKDIEEIKNFIAEGGDLNIQDEDGWTALMFAVFYENKEIAKLLIEGGAKLDIQDKYCWTALDHAESHNNEKMIQLLDWDK